MRTVQHKVLFLHVLSRYLPPVSAVICTLRPSSPYTSPPSSCALLIPPSTAPNVPPPCPPYPLYPPCPLYPPYPLYPHRTPSTVPLYPQHRTPVPPAPYPCTTPTVPTYHIPPKSRCCESRYIITQFSDVPFEALRSHEFVLPISSLRPKDWRCCVETCAA